MFNFIKKALKTGIVTEDYPLTPIKVDKTFAVNRNIIRNNVSVVGHASTLVHLMH